MCDVNLYVWYKVLTLALLSGSGQCACAPAYSRTSEQSFTVVLARKSQTEGVFVSDVYVISHTLQEFSCVYNSTGEFATGLQAI